MNRVKWLTPVLLVGLSTLFLTGAQAKEYPGSLVVLKVPSPETDFPIRNV